MSSQAAAQQRYAVALQKLQELASAPDLATAAKMAGASHFQQMLVVPAEYHGLTSIREFKARGPGLVNAHCAACCNVLRLFTEGAGSSSTNLDTDLKAVSVTLSTLQALLAAWYAKLPGTRGDDGGDFSELENSEVVPTVCTTDLLPRLGAAAALLATMLPPLSSSSSRQSLQSDTIILLKHSTVTILELWQGIVTSDNKEEGFSIAEPKCVAALPSICALVRAALCVLPTKKSAVDRMVPDSSVINQCMAVINFASGHLHMQYCKAFTSPAPERGCSRATAHMLARCEDYQWALQAYPAFELARTHMFTKGGTQIESGSIPGLPPGVTPSNLLEAIKKQMAKEGKADKMGGVFEELGRHMDAAEDDDITFANSNKQVAPLHERLLTALGMGTLVSSGKLGTFMSAEPVSNLDCRLSRMALWSVEHQFVQVGVPAPGIAGVPCGAHGPLLAALYEYLVTVGPEAVQFHACLQVRQRVLQDYADKQAAGKLPQSAAAAAAAAAGAASSSSAAAASTADDEQQHLDTGMVDGLAALLTAGVPACVASARNKTMSPIAAMLVCAQCAT